jgi:hypothetical protein
MNTRFDRRALGGARGSDRPPIDSGLQILTFGMFWGFVVGVGAVLFIEFLLGRL